MQVAVSASIPLLILAANDARCVLPLINLTAWVGIKDEVKEMKFRAKYLNLLSEFAQSLNLL